jgi:hypothetical protein
MNELSEPSELQSVIATLLLDTGARPESDTFTASDVVKFCVTKNDWLLAAAVLLMDSENPLAVNWLQLIEPKVESLKETAPSIGLPHAPKELPVSYT